MRQLQLRLIVLVIALALFFNLERLGPAEEAGDGLSPFIYGLVTLAVILILVAAYLPRRWLLILSLLSIPVYSVVRSLFVAERPLIGGLNSYITLSELTFVGFISVAAYLTARALAEFREAVAYLTVLRETVPSIEDAAVSIQAEMTRSRHYHRPLSLIMVDMDAHALQSQIDPLIAAAQRATAEQYARASLARELQERLRPIDLVLQADRDGRLLLLCPETDDTGSSITAERVRATLATAGVPSRYGTATFPEEGVTFEALVENAQAKLHLQESPVGGKRVRQTAPG